MTLTLSQSVNAIGLTMPASFLGDGGTEPYSYAVLPGGAGGTIDSYSGVYISPAVLVDPKKYFDTIQVTDALAATATAQISIGSPLFLFCDIIQRELGLANGRVYFWEQKIFQPTDSGLYVAISVPRVKPFGSVNEQVGVENVSGLTSRQYLACQALLDIDIISRDSSARDRKEEVVMAFNSNYSQQQQNINSFSIAQLSSEFKNLSNVDGAAIPYRYRISVHLQYSVTKTSSVQYFDNFSDPQIFTNL